MRKFLFPITGFVCAFILSSVVTATAQMCATNAGNSPGDIIQTWTDFWDQGSNGFNWDVRINGTNWAAYGAQRLDGGGCLHQCLPLQFMARTSNVTIENVVTGGNASGWKCSQFSQIVGHDEGPIKAAKKTVAQNNADIFTNLGVFFEGAMVGSCAIVFEPYTCSGSTTGMFISKLAAHHFTRIVQRDPWNPDYLTISNPPWPSVEELGLSYTDDYYQNQMIGDAQGMVQLVNFILEEVDKDQSCQMADVDCAAYGVDHRGAINYGLWMLGWYVSDLGNNAWVVAWIMEQSGANPELVDNMRYFAQTSNNAGWEFQQ